MDIYNFFSRWMLILSIIASSRCNSSDMVDDLEVYTFDLNEPLGEPLGHSRGEPVESMAHLGIFSPSELELPSLPEEAMERVLLAGRQHDACQAAFFEPEELSNLTCSDEELGNLLDFDREDEEVGPRKRTVGEAGLEDAIGVSLDETFLASDLPARSIKRKARECPDCGQLILVGTNLSRHRLIHSGVKPKECTWPGCTKTFYNSSDLSQHVTWHLDMRPYACEKSGCTRAFNRERDLQEHMSTHSGLRKYLCTHPDCVSTFNRERDLNDHISWHNGIKPNLCTYPNCTKAYFRRSDLLRHIRGNKHGR